jgi:hypothetical protein
MDNQNNLIELVIDQIAEDFRSGDLSALEELLKYLPKRYLAGYLSELHFAGEFQD